jgi:hypothetical protein
MRRGSVQRGLRSRAPLSRCTGGRVCGIRLPKDARNPTAPRLPTPRSSPFQRSTSRLVIGLGQAYVIIWNAVVPPQQPVTYSGIIVDKFKSGRYGETHVVRLSTSSPQSDIVRLLVSPAEYAHLQLGDRFSKRMVLGSLAHTIH